MHLKHKLVGAAAVLACLGGLGTATALAQTSSPTKAPSVVTPKSATPEPTSAVDTDNVQQGDQTPPDAPAAAGAEKATSEKAGAETESTTETESATDADGPGGHQDPPGNVDNQQEGNN
ncbi:MAG: hypothetical protein QOI55_2640 [Actinomycetota bacterium]|nr:hypothetical protein [Actinomycetota bacterium]